MKRARILLLVDVPDEKQNKFLDVALKAVRCVLKYTGTKNTAEWHVENIPQQINND